MSARLLAVIAAVPLRTALTTPVLLTVATPVLLLVHIMFLFAASEGCTVATSVSLAPTAMLIEVLLRLTLVTLTGWLRVTAPFLNEAETSLKGSKPWPNIGKELINDESQISRILSIVILVPQLSIFQRFAIGSF
jgi:hypothetical protein